MLDQKVTSKFPTAQRRCLATPRRRHERSGVAGKVHGDEWEYRHDPEHIAASEPKRKPGFRKIPVSKPLTRNGTDRKTTMARPRRNLRR
jgi:hypothetical protein